LEEINKMKEKELYESEHHVKELNIEYKPSKKMTSS